jgi:hypothetical protein
VVTAHSLSTPVYGQSATPKLTIHIRPNISRENERGALGRVLEIGQARGRECAYRDGGVRSKSNRLGLILQGDREEFLGFTVLSGHDVAQSAGVEPEYVAILEHRKLDGGHGGLERRNVDVLMCPVRGWVEFE